MLQPQSSPTRQVEPAPRPYSTRFAHYSLLYRRRWRISPELVADALEHIRKCVDASDTVDSLHPLGNRGEQREVQRIHIPGANAIRIDADARCELPARSTLYISPTPTQAQAVRTIKGSEQAKASEGGWMPIVVPGDTA